MNTIKGIKASETFFQRTGKKYVFNITALNNIPSIIMRGILCHDRARNIDHISVASDEVQERRSSVIVPSGKKLHSYANLYFDYHNPMMYMRKDQAERLCILVIHRSVLDIEGCVVSDRNAAAELVRFFSPLDGVQTIDFEKVYARYWDDEDPYVYREKKSVKCAEILIPGAVPYSFVLGAYVFGDEQQELMESYGFEKKIVVNKSAFFR